MVQLPCLQSCVHLWQTHVAGSTHKRARSFRVRRPRGFRLTTEEWRLTTDDCLIWREAFEGAGNFFDVVGAQSAGASEFVSEDLVNGGEGLTLGSSDELLPLTGDGAALFGIGIFAELAYSFFESTVLVSHVLMEIAAHEAAQRGKGFGGDLAVIFVSRLGIHERHSG